MPDKKKNSVIVNLAVVVAVALAVSLALWLGHALFAQGGDKRLFLTAKTSDGHHQIEEECPLCHQPFREMDEQATCLECHGEQLKAARDSHAPALFEDPRNAEQLARVNAASCRTCHEEHHGDHYPSGAAIPADFCKPCHQDVVDQRPTHEGFDFAGCRDCHNYHDNTALYEDFLEKHLDEPDTLPDPAVAQRNFAYFHEKAQKKAPKKAGESTRPFIRLAEHDGPAPLDLDAAREWLVSTHANASVNCRDCHDKEQQGWTDHPDQTYCEGCHAFQVRGFLAGKHGMRIAQGLSPMTTGKARRKMQPGDKTMTCFSCHPAHLFDTRRAAVESCLACHADEHTLAYKDSKHFLLWREEQQGKRPAGAGVSCASCHMPRIARHHLRLKQKKRKPKRPPRPRLVKVEHNQSANLNPNQRMIRGVCQNCHGLPIILDSLADGAAIRENFPGVPGKHLESMEMVKQRLQQSLNRRRKTP